MCQILNNKLYKQKMRKIIVLSFVLLAIGSAQAQESMVINGVRWAFQNVGAPEFDFMSFGNRFTWYQAQHACPPGWRLPTQEELIRLQNANAEWVQGQGMLGIRFGSGNNLIVIPAAGFSNPATGRIEGVNIAVAVWSSTRGSDKFVNGSWFPTAYAFLGSQQGGNESGFLATGLALSVRCVVR